MQIDNLKTLFEYNRKKLEEVTAPSGHSWAGRKTAGDTQTTGSIPTSAVRPDTARIERPTVAAATVPPPRTIGSENKSHALGLAKVGRTAVETLNFGIHMYNTEGEIGRSQAREPGQASGRTA